MSMPKFPDKPGISREDAINQIITSIAMEELGLSHILNAEGEKLQYVLGTLPGVEGPEPSIEELLKVNDSIKELLKVTAENQQALSEKLKAALGAEDSGGSLLESQTACGMIYDTRTIPVNVESDKAIPFTSPGPMVNAALVNNGIQVKLAGTYMVEYTVNVICKQSGQFMVAVNGKPQMPSFAFFSAVDNNFASVVSGNILLQLAEGDIVSLLNTSGTVMVGAASSAAMGAIGNLSLFKVA